MGNYKTNNKNQWHLCKTCVYSNLEMVASLPGTRSCALRHAILCTIASTVQRTVTSTAAPIKCTPTKCGARLISAACTRLSAPNNSSTPKCTTPNGSPLSTPPNKRFNTARQSVTIENCENLATKRSHQYQPKSLFSPLCFTKLKAIYILRNIIARCLIFNIGI